MKLSDLLKGIKVSRIIGDKNVEISELYMDSRAVSTGGLYFAISGHNEDGHNYAVFAAAKGAVAVVCEHEVPASVTQVVVEDSREAVSLMAANFYGNPSQKLKLIGVTGTNGKTSATFIIKSICDFAGVPAGVIGTSGCYFSGKFLPTSLTTPDPIELNKILSLMVSEGIQICAMEVSAHAIALRKVQGTNFEVKIFTNLSQDHLDYFDSMYSYRNTKMSFFSEDSCKTILTNNDDECGREIYNTAKAKGVRALSYGIDNPSDVSAADTEFTGEGTSFTASILGETFSVQSSLHGKFNVYNTVAAAAACRICGISAVSIAAGIKALTEIEGRFNVIESKRGFKVIIDYAHSPDGIKNVLGCAREMCLRKLVCVFGCGGNRDRTKRKYMGKAASDIADFCVITSDNPRFEDPFDIMREIEQGVKKQCSGYIMIENRKKAIQYALMSAQKGDIVAILGKGGEKYQEIAGVKYPYNDRETVNNILENL